VADYKIEIELLLADNGEAVLGLLGRRLLGIHGKVEDLEGGFGRLKTAIGGAFAIGGALALLDVMGKLIKKGSELEQTMYELQTIGFTPKEIAAVKSNATKVAGKYPNLTERELVKLTGETTAVYGDPAVAMKNLPIAAAYMSALKYRHPNDADGATATAEDAIFKVLRSEEMRGLAQNPAEVKRALAATLKGQEVFGDQFDPTVSFQAVKYGRLASRYLSDRFLEGPGLIMAQELGGSNFGNSINQVMQAFIGGHITKTAMREMEAIGLLDPRKIKAGEPGSDHTLHSRHHGGRIGGSESLTSFNLAGAIPKADLLQSDPDIWFNTVFRPIVDKATKSDPAKRDQILRVLMQRTTAQQMAEILGWQTGPGGRITKDINRLGLAMTPDQAVLAAQSNLATSTQNLSTQFDRLKTNLGDPMAKGAGAVAGVVIGPVKAAADASAHHPGASAAIDGVMAGAAGILGYFGVKTLWSLGKGLIDRLGGVKAVQAAENLAPEVGNGLKSVFGAFKPGMGNLIKGIAGGLGESGVMGALGKLATVRFAFIAYGIMDLVKTLPQLAEIISQSWALFNKSGETNDETAHLADQARARLRAMNNGAGVAPPPRAVHVTIDHRTVLDGRTIARSVTKHQVDMTNGPVRGPSSFDPSMSYTPIAVNTF
jgi:hypothetical protein